jgi:DNA-binding NtrC family response regulator
MTSLAPPSLNSCKVLLVEDDPRMLEMLVESFVSRLDANLTCVGNGEDALDVEMIEPHDVVVTELALPGLDGLTLAKHLMELSDRPVILLAEEPALSHAVEAMRLRAWDLFAKPFAIDELLSSTERALRKGHRDRAFRNKHRRQRQLLRQVLRERRDLNRRVDLVCRDLVGAHRRLVHRVLDQE